MRKQIVIVVCGLFVAGTAFNKAVAEESRYLSAADVSADDYRDMAEFEARYNECLAEKSRSESENYRDARHAVDKAMKHCAGELEALEVFFEEKGFPPDYRRGYFTKLSRRAVRRALPEAISAMAIRPEIRP